MPRLEYFVAAESLSVDVRKNTVSIFHVLNEVPLEEFPGTIPLLAVASAWVFDESEIKAKNECQIKFEILSPGRQDVKVFRGNLSADVRFQNLHLEIQNVPVDEPGDLIVRILLDDEEKATHTIEVSQNVG